MMYASKRGLFNWLILLCLASAAKNQNISSNLTCVSHLCPYTDFCQTKASQVFNYTENPEFSPCCSSCSCDDSCFETNICCPDKAIVADNLSVFVCKNSMVKKRGKPHDMLPFDGFVRGIKHYLIKDSCPDSENDVEIRNKCSGVTRLTLDDYVWVSAAATGKIYQNRHCAKCHNITDLRTWNIKTECSRVNETSFVNLTATLLSETCNIINEVPDEQASLVDYYQCYIPSISACNQTGLWQKYSDGIVEACKKNAPPFFQTDGLNMIIYKNLFCYVCNTNVVVSAQKICPRLSLDDRGVFKTFNALIDFKAISDIEKPSTLCDVDEVFDKYMEKCRRLYCPFGSAPASGKCRPLTMAMNNLNINVLLDLKIDWRLTKFLQKDQSPEFTKAEGEVITKRISRALGLMKCNICSLFLFNNTNMSSESSPGLGFWMPIGTNANCKYDQVLYNIDKAIGNVVKIILENREPIYILLQYTKRSVQSSLLGSTAIYSAIGAYRCFAEYTPKGRFCPGIKLMRSEVQSLQNKKAKHSLATVFGQIYDNNTSTIFVCLDDYFTMMDRTNAILGLSSSWSIPLFAYLIHVLVQ